MKLLIYLFIPLTVSLMAQAEPPAEVIFYNTHIDISKSGKTILNEVQIKINNESGRDYSQLALTYKSDDKLKIKLAQILDVDGNILKELKKSDFKKSSNYNSGSFYEDSEMIKFDLHHNSFPYQIKYVYERQTKEYFMVSNWYPFIDDKLVHQNYQLKLSLPFDYKVNIKVHGSFDTLIENGSGQIFYTWKSKEPYSYEDEYFSPEFIDIAPHISIIPEQFVYDVSGLQRTWKEYGDWIYELNKNLDELTFSDSYQVKLLTDTIDNTIDKIRVLYHYLQDNTRYVNIPLGTGGMKPYPAKYVCENKYGDCKALTIYMQALLKEAGIKSYAVDIIAGDPHEDLDKNMPGQFFNHVILCVPVNGDTIWLENTSQINPFNYLGPFTQGRWALLIDSGNSHLVKTPSLDSSDVLCSSTLQFKLGKEKEAKVDLSYNVRGNIFGYYNYAFSNISEEDNKKRILRVLNFDKAEVENFSINKVNRDARSIKIKAEILQKDAFRNLANKTVIYPESVGFPKLESPEERKHLLEIEYPIFKIDTFIYDISSLNYSDIKYPEDKLFNSEFGRYKSYTRQSEHEIVHIKVLHISTGKYPKIKYPKFHSWIENAKEFDEDFKIILTNN